MMASSLQQNDAMQDIFFPDLPLGASFCLDYFSFRCDTYGELRVYTPSKLQGLTFLTGKSDALQHQNWRASQEITGALIHHVPKDIITEIIQYCEHTLCIRDRFVPEKTLFSLCSTMKTHEPTLRKFSRVISLIPNVISQLHDRKITEFIYNKNRWVLHKDHTDWVLTLYLRNRPLIDLYDYGEIYLPPRSSKTLFFTISECLAHLNDWCNLI